MDERRLCGVGDEPGPLVSLPRTCWGSQTPLPGPGRRQQCWCVPEVLGCSIGGSLWGLGGPTPTLQVGRLGSHPLGGPFWLLWDGYEYLRGNPGKADGLETAHTGECTSMTALRCAQLPLRVPGQLEVPRCSQCVSLGQHPPIWKSGRGKLSPSPELPASSLPLTPPLGGSPRP